jgi:tRNA (guanine-N7-)-methyltransferase
MADSQWPIANGEMPMGEMHDSSLIIPLPSIVDRLAPGELFDHPRPLEVELGSGDGSFIVRYAELHPERNFIGVERLLGRLRKIDRKGRRAGLRNLRAVRIEASYFLEYLLPPGSTLAIHIYFPDPWPKRKHRRHRLVNERFPEVAKNALAAGGTVYLRTDDADYFSQMQRVFAASSFFEEVRTPEELSSVPTDFERGFHARGVSTLRSAFSLKADR